MLIDATELSAGKTLQADVAIVGAGAAGLVLARQISEAGHSVLLFESGAFQYEPEIQSRYDGSAVGPSLDDSARYLASSRLRYFGGSTNHWGGWCRPLDAIDLEKREGVPHSGWPISHDELTPFYRRAETVLEIPGFAGQPSAATPSRFLLPESERIRTRLFQIKGLRFRTTQGRHLLDSSVEIFVHANLTRIELDESGARVTGLVLASRPGHTFRARAKCYLLATGGIENARILLASNQVQKEGIGNERGLVGRFFMEHPHLQVGSIFLTARAEDAALYVQRKSQGMRHQAVFSLSTRELRRHHLPNGGIALQARQSPGSAPPDDPVAIAAEIDRLRSPGRAPYSGFRGHLYARWEQRPNPQSRVLLDTERDDLGMPRARLEWQLTAEDAATITHMVDVLTRELGRWAAGRVHSDLDPENPWRGVIGGNHHMGTTRMATTPEEGVVDPDGRVFGVENLWIAGSSLFPTVGFANPTMTLIALAHRLGDHIDRRLSREETV